MTFPPSTVIFLGEESDSRLLTANRLEQAVENVKLIQESVAENDAVKPQVVEALDSET
jgi:3-hydroxyacyl-CoA dehydrogenase